jgi:hypothetical protein
LAGSELPGLAPVPESPLPLEAPMPLNSSPTAQPPAVASAGTAPDGKAKAPNEPRTEDKTPPADKPAAPAPAPVTAANTAPAKDEKKDAPVQLALAEAAPPASATPTAPAPAAGAVGDWAEVRRTMRTLGVSRYGIEGEPNGRVRFHCVIPVAGRRAVGQHFEAEADDDLQAARACLHRVALWRATEDANPK